MSKATPGPWIIRETPTHIAVIGANNETLFHDDKRCPAVIEDARLIAAAPDMLDALKLVVDTFEDGGWPSATIVIAKAAIAKAEDSDAAL